MLMRMARNGSTSQIEVDPPTKDEEDSVVAMEVTNNKATRIGNPNTEECQVLLVRNVQDVVEIMRRENARQKEMHATDVV